ncbi:MAG: hypothetical protein JXR94_00170 [Candidatus Hydrogenedentes bacterium]|nr:hypothetical protein [Candidatus Hydrogenedentota bacterium]
MHRTRTDAPWVLFVRTSLAGLAAAALILGASAAPAEAPAEAGALGAPGAHCAEVADAAGAGKTAPIRLDAPESEDGARPLRWFLFVAAANPYPRIESEDLIDATFNPAMHFLAPGYDDVGTVGDLRDRGMLWTPYIGLGYILSERWSVFVQAGYASGKVRTKDDDWSILLVPIHTDFEIERGALYAGLGLDYFPWGMPELREYSGIRDRLRGARPTLGTRLTWTYATYDVKVQVGLRDVQNLINYELSDAWLLPSFNANVGVDVPLSKRSVFSANVGYNFFVDRAYDFAGPSLVVGWKYHF